jgi:hypothetical protein
VLSWGEKDTNAYIGYLSDQIQNEDDVEEILSKNANALDLIRAGVERKFWQPAPRQTFATDDCAEVEAYISLGRLVLLSAQHSLSRGDASEAARMTGMLLAYVRLLVSAPESESFWVFVEIIERDAMTMTRRISRSERVSGEDLRVLLGALGRREYLGEGLVYALKVEYSLAARTVDGLADGTISSETLERVAKPSDVRPPSRFMLHPNATKSAFAKYYSDMVENVGLPMAEMHLYSEFEAMGLSPDGSADNRFDRVNTLGRTLFRAYVLNMRPLLKRLCIRECSLEATRLVLAMNIFRRATGAWPKKLSELVPEYLATEPTDAFDGMLFRLNLARGIVYSVGTDLVDSGGDGVVPNGQAWPDEGDRWEAPDLAYRFRY